MSEGTGGSRFLGRVLAIALALAVLSGVALAAYGLTWRPGRADVAIVFGNTVERSGQPSGRLVARLEAARRLFAAGEVRTVFVSGARGREGFEESRIMRGWLTGHGVPARAIVRDSLGANTTATAAHARAWMRSHRARSAVVVTQYFHVARALLACRRAGIEELSAVAPVWFEPRDL